MSIAEESEELLQLVAPTKTDGKTSKQNEELRTDDLIALMADLSEQKTSATGWVCS